MTTDQTTDGYSILRLDTSSTLIPWNAPSTISGPTVNLRPTTDEDALEALKDMIPNEEDPWKLIAKGDHPDLKHIGSFMLGFEYFKKIMIEKYKEKNPQMIDFSSSNIHLSNFII